MLWGLLFTFLCGLFFLGGMFLYRASKNKTALTIFASACAFVVILGLICFDLLPEIKEFSHLWTYLFILVGFLVIHCLDLLIPHHHHHHHDNDYATKAHVKHLEHIGIITIIALTLHNFIEGIGLYSLTVNN